MAFDVMTTILNCHTRCLLKPEDAVLLALVRSDDTKGLDLWISSVNSYLCDELPKEEAGSAKSRTKKAREMYSIWQKRTLSRAGKALVQFKAQERMLIDLFDDGNVFS